MFFETWVDCQGDSFSEDRSGFQLVSTLVQALGLIFNLLWKTFRDLAVAERKNYIYQAAKKLGSPDFSRKATHWSDCTCVSLNAAGDYAVTSGGAFSRIQFAEHLAKN